MYLNDFSVRIPGGTETPGGYVEMRHTQTYTISMRNNRDVRCDARVVVGGKHVGTWRIGPRQSIVIERPAHDTGRFTFYKLGTQEANAAQLNGGDPNLGLVKVTFTPERARRHYPVQPEPLPWPAYPWPHPKPYPRPNWTYRSSTSGTKSLGMPSASAGYQSRSAGGTGLSGVSGQQFVDVGRIDYDYSQETTIHLRLVCEDDHGPRPLTSTSNPVPPRVW